MNKLKCLIVEDEPLAAEGLESYISDVPFLELAGTCHDAISALDFLKNKHADVLFLDIHLPKLKGLDFLKLLKNPPQVILTTAYHQYAIESYEFQVTDYLLKPYGFSRFLQAVNKLKFPEKTATQKEAAGPNRPFHFFNENKKNIKVYFDEILYVESLKEYVKIHLQNGSTVVTRFQIGELTTFLDNSNFLRIHRSFLVAIDKVTAFSASHIEMGDNKLPIGRGYKTQVMEQLSNG